ncbi:hypothetical protein TSMEX_010300 [Taenia solium]|eukprot:TsM_001120000 transcript=TsM_001120000 gene=TsM_001120000
MSDNPPALLNVTAAEETHGASVVQAEHASLIFEYPKSASMRLKLWKPNLKKPPQAITTTVTSERTSSTNSAVSSPSKVRCKTKHAKQATHTTYRTPPARRNAKRRSPPKSHRPTKEPDRYQVP